MNRLNDFDDVVISLFLNFYTLTIIFEAKNKIKKYTDELINSSILKWVKNYHPSFKIFSSLLIFVEIKEKEYM